MGCWWTVGAGLLPKYFSVGANCGIHALSYSRFVIIQGRWQEESGEHMQIQASDLPLLVGLRKTFE